MSARCVLTLFTLLASAAYASAVSASAEREAGRELFFSAGCIACHAIACNRDGPKLEGVVGRRAGAVADYDHYSEAIKTSDIVWSEATLDAFLADPAGFLPGNGMASAAGKMEDAGERRALIAFLKEPDTSQDLCF